MRLYRPSGLEEMALVLRSGMRRWPPRLPEQPIFYPVTNRAYAEQISRDWNTALGTRFGYVTAFEVDDAYASRFDRKIVGASGHEELWVPAEELEAFNDEIEGVIEVEGLFVCESARGFVPNSGPWTNLGASEQLAWLSDRSPERILDVVREYADICWLHTPLWRAVPGGAEQVESVAQAWEQLNGIALPACTAAIVENAAKRH